MNLGEYILNALKNNEIVDNNLVLIDKVTKTTTTLFITKTTYYIYENQEIKIPKVGYSYYLTKSDDRLKDILNRM